MKVKVTRHKTSTVYRLEGSGAIYSMKSLAYHLLNKRHKLQDIDFGDNNTDCLVKFLAKVALIKDDKEGINKLRLFSVLERLI